MKKIARIVNTHGIRGELRLISQSDFISERLVKDTPIIIKKRNTQYYEVVQSIRFHKNFVLLTLQGKNNINDVEHYKTFDLYIEEQAMHEVNLDEDEFYIDDLIGLDVYENDKCIGNVNDVIDNPAHDIFKIWIEAEKRYALVPYVDEFILNVDIDNKRIDVALIKGM